MSLKSAGEFGLINRIRRIAGETPGVIAGIGDDCAVLPYTAREYLLYTVDMIVEGVDFLRKEDPALVGRKAVAVSMSDIAACGGCPKWALVTVAAPADTRVEKIEKIYRGMAGLCRKYGAAIVGGDISSGPKLSIDVSMIGVVGRKRLVLRRGAKPGDVILVTGALGGSIRGKHLSFEPRLKEAGFITKNFAVHAMIDISDGLSQDLGHILEASGVGAVLHADSIPLSAQASGLDDALYSGEDFELLVTMPLKEARRLLKRTDMFTPVGEIVPARHGLSLITSDGRRVKMIPKGFRHF